MSADFILTAIAFLLMILGIIGCIAPLLPGPPLCYIALLVAQASGAINFSMNFLIFWLIVIIIISVLDYYIPIWGTKIFGGTRAGLIGSGVGLIGGFFFFPPMGIVLGPVIGAFIGELLANRDDIDLALKSAMGAVLGFFISTGLKLGACGVMAFYLVKAVIAN